MEEKKWTAEQQRVIDARDSNILVSAAAGSGKTAVLVQRIIERISSKEDPVSIDELLIVTFTKAAAGEMRERIGGAIEKKVMECPDDVHLQKQLTLLYNAQITTIDSFCMYVIRNYFHTIDLDPAFRVADEAELTLLKNDVLSDLLEARYEDGSEEFLNFVECYAGAKSDHAIEDLVLKLYQFSMSYPWPHEWLFEHEHDFEIGSVDELYSCSWMKELVSLVKKLLSECRDLNQRALSICKESGGPKPYTDALLSDSDMISLLLKQDSYQGLYEQFSHVTFARLSTKKDPEAVEEKKESVKAIREQYKKILSNLLESFFFQEPKEMVNDLLLTKKPMEELFSLTHDFIDALAKAKEEANIVDFNDIEHFALNILIKKSGDEITPTQAAIDLSSQFKEIMIDEYQDSNLLQEYILNSISKIRDGQYNVFMVGDVKQSIYKFRLARPELFMDKYARYQDKGPEIKIELSKNFRSRACVLESINRIFYKIMVSSLGGIDYTKEAALYPGAEYIETPKDQNKTELIVVDINQEKEEELSEDLMEFTAKEYEAYAIAKRIKEMMDPDAPFLVSGGKKLRKAEYSDIVILLRTMSNWSEIFIETLLSQGIPCYSDTQSGYFQTLEIKTMLNYLRILDNPEQELAFTAVLFSPFAFLTSNELAIIKTASKAPDSEHTCSMYASARQYAVSGNDQEIKNKITEFFNAYDLLLEKKLYLTVHELIQEIYAVTGYQTFVSAMPGGSQRKENLNLLISHAINFEQSSYHGLFQFIRYVERLLKYEIDYGESSENDSADNAVRIMSIHKSKGLEFPIVFVGGMGKNFNQMDARDKIVLHPDYGIGPECVDTTLRTKIPTILKKVIQNKITFDNLGEELRVFYVALTRAKEKLIMIGTVKDADEAIKSWKDTAAGITDHFMFQTLSSAKNYFSYAGPAAVGEEDLISVCVEKIADFTGTEVTKLKNNLERRELLSASHFKDIKNSSIHEELLNSLSYVYPFASAAKLPVKTTVTELKKSGQDTDEELSDVMKEVSQETTANTEFVPTIPQFLKDTKEIKPSDKGTCVHKIMECLDFSKITSKEELSSFVAALSKKNIVDAAIVDKISLTPILSLLDSPLGQRLKTAQMQGKLFKEQQFVLGISSAEIIDETDSEDIVLIQGIIDAYFEEDGEIVLLDYKTDYVPDDQEQLLILRYQKQLDYYERAITQITGKKVKEKLIYSFYLRKTLHLA